MMDIIGERPHSILVASPGLHMSELKAKMRSAAPRCKKSLGILSSAKTRQPAADFFAVQTVFHAELLREVWLFVQDDE